MKNTKLFMLLIAICMIALFNGIVNAQAPPVRIRLSQPPPGQLGASDLWKATLTNTSGKEIKIYLKGTATEEKDGLIVEGTTKTFIMPAGTREYKYEDFKNGEVAWKNNRYKDVVLRTGQAPEGNYTICMTAMNEQGAIVGVENCITQIVVGKTQGELTLVSPSSGEEIDPNQPLIFSWSGPNTNGPYTLKIAEVKGEQSPEEAMKTKSPFFQQGGLNSKTFQYPPSAPKLEKGRKYAWQVSFEKLFSDAGKFIINTKENNNDTSSLTIELISPNGENKTKESRPEFIFRASDKKDIESFTLTIFELILNKETFNIDTSKIFYEAKGLKVQSWKYAENAPLMDTAKYYAWKVVAIGKSNIILGSSALGITFNPNWFPPPPPPNTFCACNWPIYILKLGIPTISTRTICLSSGTFPIINETSHCTGVISNIWSSTYTWGSSFPPHIGTFLYTYQVYYGSHLCPFTYQVNLNVIDPTVRICSNTTLPYKQCCGDMTFRLTTDLSTAPCTASTTIDPFFLPFPHGTQIQWYIMKKSSGSPSSLPVASTALTYTYGNTCSFPPNLDQWYKFGTGLLIQGFPGTPSDLTPTTGSQSYYVTCYINFPGGGSSNCIQSGFTGYFPFTVNPNPNITADTVSVNPTCVTIDGTQNGSITLTSVTGATGTCSITLNSGTAVNVTHFPYTINTLSADNTGHTPTTSYTVRIEDASHCVKTYTFNLTWCGPSKPTVSYQTSLQIPCNNNTIQLTSLPNVNNPTGVVSYQWEVCSCAPGCNGVYSNVASGNTQNININIPGCYRVTYTYANGCNTSNSEIVTSLNPAAQPTITGPYDFCSGSSITLITAGTNLQWYKDGNIITGATGTSYTVTATGNYTVTSTSTGTSPCTTSSIGHNVIICPPCTCGTWQDVTVTQNGHSTTALVNNHSVTFPGTGPYGSYSATNPIQLSITYICGTGCTSSYEYRTFGMSGPPSAYMPGPIPINTSFPGLTGFTIAPYCGTTLCENDSIHVFIFTK